MKHDRALAYAAFAVVCVVWGTPYLAIRIAVTTMTPFLLTGARFLFRGIVLFIVAKLHGDAIPRDRRVLGDVVLCGVPRLMSSALEMLTGGIVFTLAGAGLGELPHFHSTPRTFAALAYLSLFGSVLAYTSYVYAARHLRTTTLSLYAYVNPVVAVILGWLVLHEELTWVSITAMVVILGGVAMVQSGRGRPQKVTFSRDAVAEKAA